MSVSNQSNPTKATKATKATGSKYNTSPTADTTSAGLVSHAKRSASVIDTVTKAEAAALAIDGISTTRYLTALTAHDIKGMAPEALRDLAASMGKSFEGTDKECYNCSPDGKIGGVFRRVMDFRRAESRALGHASRRIQNMRVEAMGSR